MKKFLRYLKDYRKESILAPFFKMLEASFELLVPLVVASMIDTGIHDKDQEFIIKASILLVLFGVIGLSCSITAQYFCAKAAAGVGTKLRHDLFSHIQSFSFAKQDQLGSSTLITRMTSDINQVQSGVNMFLRLVLRAPFIVFGAMIMAFTVDHEASMVFLAAILLLSIVVFSIMLISIPQYKKVQERLDKVVGLVRENLAGVRVIRAFGSEEQELAQLQAGNNELTKMQNLVGRLTAFMNPLTYCIINGALIVLLYQGGHKVNMGELSQGQVVALINYMSQILVELIKLANFIILMTKAVACGNRIQQVLEMPIGQESLGQWQPLLKAKEAQPFIEFRNVSFMYQGAGGSALTDISFTVNVGETVGIIGGTGSGKTTLVQLLPRFYDVTSGQILVNGIDINQYSLKNLRQKIAFVLQKSILFRGTIRENMLWGKEDATDQEINQALQIAQASEIIAEKEQALQTEVAQSGNNFSGGQRQRLTIARALVRKPDILILDDSASALDYATEAKLRKSIQEIKEQPVTFIVSQRISSIQHADKIIVLEDGKIEGMGAHKQLLDNCQVYKEIYGSQNGGEGMK
jgi:ABC-type multidrug transport system fused ATPase/permease subunit